jgi:hypothetical protein
VELGFTLQPDDDFLDRCAPLFGRADYFEIAPETTWFEDAGGALRENGYHRRFAAIGAGKSFVAHGVGFSLGTDAEEDATRRARWLERLREDQRVFAYRWYTDHLGATSLGGRAVSLPLPLPMTDHAASVVRARLRDMQTVVPEVGLENSVPYFTLGDALEEPVWLRKCICDRGHHLLLDLHNVHTMASNAGFDAGAWLARADLSRVIEIHVSGGSPSDPAWLPSGRSVRLDAHDSAVPEPVWALLERWAPRCPGLRGVTLERMEGTVRSDADVAELAGELARARAIAARLPGPPLAPSLPSRDDGSEVEEAEADEDADADAYARFELAMAAAIRAPDPVAAIRATADALPDEIASRLRGVDPDGVRIAALLVAKLRFERLLRGSRAIEAAFERDPRAFSERFRRYHEAVPMSAFFPPDEAAGFVAWCDAVG